MKNLMQFHSLIVLLCLLGLSCRQITKSVDETFHPNDSLVKKYDQEQKFRENGVDKGITKSSSTTSVQRKQEKTIVINSDTVNTPEMELKAKEMLHDIELLKQKNDPSAAKEIQKRVNEFLKEMKLPQGDLKNIDTDKPVVKAKKGILSATALEKAEDQLKNLPRYRNKEILLYQSVHFYDNGSINLMLQHPVNPKYIDAYEYRDGAWSAPKPVLATDIERRTFPLDEIHFADAHRVIQVYNDRAAQVEGAKPTSDAYITIWDNRMRWAPRTINGTRERYDIQFNNNGTLKSFRQE